MDKLICWSDISDYKLENIESPFFASFRVEDYLEDELSYPGLDAEDFEEEHEIGEFYPRSGPDELEAALESVEEGSWLLVTDEPFSPLSDPDNLADYPHIARAHRQHHAPQDPPMPTFTDYARRPPQPVGADPGFYVVPRTSTQKEVLAELFGDRATDFLRPMRQLNSDTGEIKAGEIFILTDENNFNCQFETTNLTRAASKVRSAQHNIAQEDAEFQVDHHSAIQDFLSYASTGVGIGESMIAYHLKAIEGLLKEIDALHVRTYVMHGNLRNPAFFAERKVLFDKLDASLSKLVRKGIGFPDHPDLKKALGISSRSLVHHWKYAGAPGPIPGYTAHFDGVSRAAKYLKAGGYIGIGLGAGAAYMNVREVCQAGETQECKKIRVSEAGGFSGALGGAMAGGYFAARVAPACVVLGFPVAIAACGIALVGAGSLIGGVGGGAGGEFIADFIYEHTP
ncbi:hypothetical protein SFA35_08645 [Pseudomonas sp. HR96]|uniref:hypothetical protein n=1 Tax=Pseudomonas sp. HR96 TaxID=1027966 RepID=UPI002A75B720|nr:hypothetical protein [Pseudomonas sp. HR96]WPP01411.1 hypothetical protein SFA35_08645 [Pseudomonas sp. HR96]